MMTIFENVQYYNSDKEKLQEIINHSDVFSMTYLDVVDKKIFDNFTVMFVSYNPSSVLSIQLDNYNDFFEDNCVSLQENFKLGLLFNEKIAKSLNESIVQFDIASSIGNPMIDELEMCHFDITFVFNDNNLVEDITVEAHFTTSILTMSLISKIQVNTYKVNYNIISYAGSELYNEDLEFLPKNVIECFYIEKKLHDMNYHPYPSRVEIKENLEHFVSLINMTNI